MFITIQRMGRYSSSETHFALLSVGEQRKTIIETELSAMTIRLSVLDLAVRTGEGKSSVLSDGFLVGEGIDALTLQRGSTLLALENLKGELEDENIKLKKQKEENVRRRHNYVPMAIALLRQLARKRELSGLITAAEERRAVNIANRKQQKKN